MWLRPVSCSTVRVDRATEDELTWLGEYLSYRDEKARFVRGAPEKRTMLNRFSSTFPMGMLALVQRAAAEQGYAVDVLGPLPPPVQPRTDADLAWLRWYQREAVDAIVAKTRGILWLPTGCLTGDTRLLINRGGAVRPYELRTVVHRLAGRETTNRAGRTCSWDLSVPTFTQSVDTEGYVRKNRIVHGWSNGVAPVFEVVTRGGRVLRATAEHHFMTSGGAFQPLRELRPGGYVMVAVWPQSVARRRGPSYAQVPHMHNHPFAQITNSARDGRIVRVPLHRLVVEARENRLSVEAFIGRIVLGQTDGLTFLDPELWHVHHRDGDRGNNSDGNLVALPAREHLALHGRTEGWKHVAGRVVPERIDSITLVGEEETFDLQMADPMNNYVANEVAVHNSGKTEIAVALTRVLPCPWLAVVHRAQLAEQMAKRYELRTPGAVAGRVFEGQWSVPEGAALVCATFQTLSRGLETQDPRVIALLRQARGLLVDEAHTLPAGTFWKVAQECVRAHYRCGLSGTPLARGDKRSLLAIAALGPIAYRIKAETLIEEGVLAKPTIHMVPVGQQLQAATWAGVHSQGVVKSKKRNAALVEMASRAEKPALMFVKEVAHGRELEKRLLTAGISAKFVYGKHSLEHRERQVRDLLAGRCDVLVCTVIFQEGIDIPELRSVVNAAGGASIIAAIQRVGRGIRVTEGKTAFEVWDVADDDGKWLRKHARARRAAFISEGYDVQETHIVPHP